MLLLKADPEKEKRALEAERFRIQRRRLAEEARRADARSADADQRDRDEAARTARDERRHKAFKRWSARAQTAGRLAVMSITNVGVNVVAVAGQFLVFQAMGWPTLLAVLGAAIVESVAVYVSWHAHVALREGDSAWWQRMTSYLIGAAAGYLNFTHVPETPELFAACSLASPWLWSMHSRHLHRKDLRQKKLIDPRAPKFSPLRWVLHTGETFAAFRWAVGEGIQSPTAAVQVVRQARRVEMTWRSVAHAQGAVISAQRSQLQLTLTRMAALAEETRGLGPDAEKAMHDAAVFVNEVGAGLVPRYRPSLGPVAAVDRPDHELAQTPVRQTGPRSRYRTRIRDHFRLPRLAKNRIRNRIARRAAGPVSAPDQPDQTPGVDVPGPVPRNRTNRTKKRPVHTGPTGPADRVNALLPLGRTIAEQLTRSGQKVTRRTLQAALREADQTVSTAVANDLVRLLTGPDRPDQRTTRAGRTTGRRTGPADQTRDQTSGPDQHADRTNQNTTAGDAA
ncbi:hypothetical protein [Nonomuraea basaltis]|uniref:hypothetical protein n=1 Tax=Nonomuraea basaltis TaxID=2495887 RepID=UPI00110C412E|nr:hypothetical protein [Nonomuraea basaltis]TMR99483.1 hypothetical protein EJK15_06625 [Nonomuraea basaltis]